MLTPKDALTVYRMRRHGIVNPILTLRAARKANLYLPLACALLGQESGGGHNEFGHDPTIFVGAGAVTKTKYHAYLARRGVHGAGGMQGVGPCQLTWYSYQDAADKLGGCWKPYPNMLIGFGLLESLVMDNGIFSGIAKYNGVGESANSYTHSVLAKRELWRTWLHM